MNAINELSFETAYAELESIISKLESGELPLEESVTLFERGRQLSDHCQTLLDKAELRVNQLSGDGKIEAIN
ncbi:MAG: exodeoxyribonuclease VII small subunit [Anaerolineae bacterium]|nr:exodeoxyribonuclease VII small subunit [Anaerolineae bacterium]